MKARDFITSLGFSLIDASPEDAQKENVLPYLTWNESLGDAASIIHVLKLEEGMDPLDALKKYLLWGYDKVGGYGSLTEALKFRNPSFDLDPQIRYDAFIALVPTFDSDLTVLDLSKQNHHDLIVRMMNDCLYTLLNFCFDRSIDKAQESVEERSKGPVVTAKEEASILEPYGNLMKSVNGCKKLIESKLALSVMGELQVEKMNQLCLEKEGTIRELQKKLKQTLAERKSLSVTKQTETRAPSDLEKLASEQKASSSTVTEQKITPAPPRSTAQKESQQPSAEDALQELPAQGWFERLKKGFGDFWKTVIAPPVS
jgi:hypothetical protein